MVTKVPPPQPKTTVSRLPPPTTPLPTKGSRHLPRGGDVLLPLGVDALPQGLQVLPVLQQRHRLLLPCGPRRACGPMQRGVGGTTHVPTLRYESTPPVQRPPPPAQPQSQPSSLSQSNPTPIPPPSVPLTHLPLAHPPTNTHTHTPHPHPTPPSHPPTPTPIYTWDAEAFELVGPLLRDPVPARVPGHLMHLRHRKMMD